MTFCEDSLPNSTMSLVTLPIEILTIIIQNLDTKSVYNLYESCDFFKHIIRTPGVVRKCRFSLSTLATVKSFNLDFSRDIAGHLKTVDLSDIQDLSISPLLLALEYLTNLEDLDVTYTNIIMPDFLDIIEVRPTLKSLAINFMFSKKIYRFTTDLLLEYQEACKGLENVHFVGSKNNLVYGKEAIFMLNKANLHTYRITIFGEDFVYTRNSNNDDEYMQELAMQKNWDDIVVMKKVSYFNAYFIPSIIRNHLSELPIFKIMDINNCELIQLQRYFRIFVHATPLMKKFICDNFDIEVNDLSEIFKAVVGEVNVMLWKKELTQFDGKFYSNLFKTLREHITYSLDPSNLVPVPTKYKWYRVEDDPVNGVNSQSNFESNYDNALKEKEDVKLKISFKENLTKPIILNNCNFLKRLTFLSLFGNVQYTPEFFKNLFVNAHSLVTLCIMNTTGTFSVLKMLEFLPKCRSLKNILLHFPEIYFFPLFGYLSACRNLENINLTTMERSFHLLPNPTSLIRNCVNLYNFYIKADMQNRQKKLEVFNKVKSDLGRNYLNISIVSYSENPNNCGGPNFSVFNVYELQPVKQKV